MNWLHCNKCAIQPRDAKNNVSFYLTNCSHIFCNQCRDAVSPEPCFVCNAVSVRCLKIGANMPNEVKALFQDCTDEVASICKSYTFQENHFKEQQRMQGKHIAQLRHRLQLQSHNVEDLSQKLKRSQDEKQDLKEKIKMLEERNNELQLEIARKNGFFERTRTQLAQLACYDSDRSLSSLLRDAMNKGNAKPPPPDPMTAQVSGAFVNNQLFQDNDEPMPYTQNFVPQTPANIRKPESLPRELFF